MMKQFADLNYTRPDLKPIQVEAKQIERLLIAANPDYAMLREKFQHFSELYLNFNTARTLVELRHTLEPEDEFYGREKAWFEMESVGAMSLYYHVLAELALINYPVDEESIQDTALLNHARSIAKTYGRIETELLEQEYLLVQWLNERIGQVKPHRFAEHMRFADARTRLHHYQNLSRKLQEDTAQHEAQYRALVNLRKKMAQAGGFSYFNFVSYQDKGRDYQRHDLVRLRESIGKYFLPVIAEVNRLRDKRLGLNNPLYFDSFVYWPQGDGQRLETDRTTIELFQESLVSIIGEEAERFNSLIRSGYWSSAAQLVRLQEMGQTLLPEHKAVFLALPFRRPYYALEDAYYRVGLAIADLAGLMNFSGLASAKQPSFIRELSGLAMSFLSHRRMKPFYGEQARLHNEIALVHELIRIPTALAIDAFESIVYDHSIQHQLPFSDVWKQTEKTYFPDFDYGSDGFFSQGHSWQLHFDLYNRPFHSLDRVMALIVILAERPHRDRRNRLEKKLNQLLLSNPDLPIGKRLELCGFCSPFEKETVRRAAFSVCDFLHL